jgi:alkylated DNA repair dioxygenase AlkB
MNKNRKAKSIIQGLYYNSGFLNGPKKKELIHELEAYHPIWESRYSESNPPPPEDTWRMLKRPVYWLGNWQFACHGYYHPPEQIDFRCVKAEAFPPLMQSLVNEIEAKVHKLAIQNDVPQGWHLNTCLVNYYGSQMDQNSNKEIDLATVGDHKDAEPGPVASISLGERAWFQFVKGRPQDSNNIVHQMWLDDASLLIFWGKRFKEDLFHRVQRVENKQLISFKDHLTDYRTRRINLTFRYVPSQHILNYNQFPKEKIQDTIEYVKELARFSSYWKDVFNNINNTKGIKI